VKLTDIDKLSILNTVRFPYLTHEELLEAAQDPLVQPAKDLILEGLSVQLSKLQSPGSKYSYRVKHAPRNSYNTETTLQ
jgi:hypothetical protein